jgi:hypothetical protein
MRLPSQSGATRGAIHEVGPLPLTLSLEPLEILVGARSPVIQEILTGQEVGSVGRWKS